MGGFIGEPITFTPFYAAQIRAKDLVLVNGMIRYVARDPKRMVNHDWAQPVPPRERLDDPDVTAALVFAQPRNCTAGRDSAPGITGVLSLPQHDRVLVLARDVSETDVY